MIPIVFFRYDKTVFVADVDARRILLSLESLSCIDQIAATNCPQSLLQCLRFLSSAEEMPPHWRTFIRDVATASPVSAFIHDIDVLRGHIRDQELGTFSVQTLEAFQYTSPVLFAFLSVSDIKDRTVSLDVFRDLLSVLIKLCGSTKHQLPAYEMEERLECYPKLPPLVARGCYTADKLKEPPPCKKRSKVQKPLLPSIFLLYCQHGELIVINWYNRRLTIMFLDADSLSSLSDSHCQNMIKQLFMGFL